MNRIDFTAACAGCGAGLAGVDFLGRCPVCSRSVSDTINLDLIDRSSRTVSCDVACDRCGYNLRTLPIASICPECAAPVSRSLYGRELRHADVRWLRRIRWGVALLLIITLLDALQVRLWVLAERLIFRDAKDYGGWWYVCHTMGLVLLAVAVFAVTSSRPLLAVRGEFRRLRLVARISVAVWAVLYVFIWHPVIIRTLLGAATESSSAFLSDCYFTDLYVFLSVQSLIGALGLATWICLLLILRGVARREQRVWLARLAVLLIAILGMLAVLFCIPLLEELAYRLSPRNPVLLASGEWFRMANRGGARVVGHACTAVGLVTLVAAWHVLKVAIAARGPRG